MKKVYTEQSRSGFSGRSPRSLGFTLAEILVVLGILSILGLIVLTIFTRSLRGTNKTQIILAIKENGQSVLETIDKAIRSSDNLVCPALPAGVMKISSNTLVIFKEGLYTRYRISLPDDSTTSPTCLQNGCITVDLPTKTAEETTDQLFINRVCNSTDPLVSPTILTDTDPDKGVLLSGGIFSLDRKAGFKDSMTVEFTLKAPPGAPSAVAGQIDPVTFETTVQLR